VKPRWEGIDALFTLRNMLAHGRAITSKVVFPANDTDRWQNEYQGGYRKVHAYLTKTGVISSAVDPLAMDWFCLKDEVSDHFWDLSFKMVTYIGESLGGQAADAFKFAVYRPEHALIAGALVQSQS
jgi:hypothetical protein